MQRQELRARQAAGSMACVSFLSIDFLVCLKPTLCRKSSGQKFFGAGTYFAADPLTYEGLNPQETSMNQNPNQGGQNQQPGQQNQQPGQGGQQGGQQQKPGQQNQ